MKKKEIYKILDDIAALSLAEDWDNSGVQVDAGNEDISSVLCTLELNDAVIGEAEEKGVQLIISHHPLMLEGIRSLDAENVPSRYVLRLAAAGISCFSLHTCFDVAAGGMNDYLAEYIGLRNITASLEQIQGVPQSRLLRTGDIHEPMKLSAYAVYLRGRLNSGPGFRVCGDPDSMIRRVCVCAGAGSGFWREALESGAELYVSGDIKHHDAAAAAECGLAIIDTTHAGTEFLFAPNIASQLRARVAELDIFEAESRVNPFSFQLL